jgi:hypothetical protein
MNMASVIRSIRINSSLILLLVFIFSNTGFCVESSFAYSFSWQTEQVIDSSYADQLDVLNYSFDQSITNSSSFDFFSQSTINDYQLIHDNLNFKNSAYHSVNFVDCTKSNLRTQLIISPRSFFLKSYLS